MNATLKAQAQAVTCDPSARVTRSLLGYGVLAGPFYAVLVLVQAALRPGFDLTRHDASLLSNGDLGWLQIANFLLTGAMVIACAVGISRALGRGATWGPRLLGIYGLGLMAAGLFRADPMNGFPSGAPTGMPSTITTSGMLHIISAAIGFLAFVAGCIALGRRFASEGRPGMARYSYLTGAAFLIGFGAIASGLSNAVVVLGFWAVLINAWAWLALVAIRIYRLVGVAAGV